MFFYVFMKDFTRTEVSLPDRYMYILSEISRGLDIPFLIAQNNTKILTFRGGGGGAGLQNEMFELLFLVCAK